MAILPDMEISYNGYTQSVRAIQVKQMDIFNLNYVCNSPRFFYVIGKDTIMPFSGCSPIQAIDKNNYPEYIVEVASIDGKKADIEIIRVKKDVLDSEIKYKGEFDQRG